MIYNTKRNFYFSIWSVNTRFKNIRFLYRAIRFFVLYLRSIFLILGIYSSMMPEDSLFELHSNINFRKKNTRILSSRTQTLEMKNNFDESYLVLSTSIGKRNLCSKLYHSEWEALSNQQLKIKVWRVDCTWILCWNGCQLMKLSD